MSLHDAQIAENLLIRHIRAAAEAFAQIEGDDFIALFDRWGKQRLMLLGEATHGTSEFYRARSAITRHLVKSHGFRIVALEADWPDVAVLDRYIRGKERPSNPVTPFQRFPQWMWRNQEFAALVEWLRQWNQTRAEADQVRLCGLDMYSLGSSMRVVLDYLEQKDPQAAAIARERYGCLEPWSNQPSAYGLAVRHHGYRACEEAVVKQCRDMLEWQLKAGLADGDELMDAAQNARLVAAAERYYRTIYQGGASSWNLRDSHMADTLGQILTAFGPDSKAIVWAHNSHIGDARFTEMGRERNEHNLGQLARQKWGKRVTLIGFGTHSGQVAAADDWESPMEIKIIRPSHTDSFENLCHESGPQFLLDLTLDPFLIEGLSQQMPQRFIGVVYCPETEYLSHYMNAAPARQFDAWIWFDRTQPVTPLKALPNRGVPDTWPFGM